MLVCPLITLLLGVTLLSTVATANISLTPISSFAGEGDEGGEAGAEISAYDSAGKQLFIVNTANNRLDVLDLSDPSNPVQLPSVDLSPFGGGVNSVAIHEYSRLSLMAVAMQAPNKQEKGTAEFFKLGGGPAEHLESVEAGALPDMVTFTPDGKYALVANEGEPNDDYTVDPVGSITVVRVIVPGSGKNIKFKTKTAGFEGFNSDEAALKAAGVRIFGPGATVAQDLEPEYIAVSADSKTAWVSLQENNAFAIVKIPSARVTDIVPLGLKDRSIFGNELDPSDKDSGINIQNWPVFGMFQPDSISAFEVGGKTYVATANEGDARDYDGFTEEGRVNDLTLDPTVFPDAATLQLEANLGRLKTTTVEGDLDGDGDVDQIYAYGGRSFSIWDSEGILVWDSGSEFADITSVEAAAIFNSQGDMGSFDSRSDDKGCEPEGLVSGKVGSSTYVFIGLERIGGIMVYDVSEPTAPVYIEYVRNEGDRAPEGLTFVSAAESPLSNTPLLIVTNEVSSTTTVYRID